MTLTIALPDDLAQRVAAAAASAGLEPDQYITRVLAEQVEKHETNDNPEFAYDAAKPWMRNFGISKPFADELKRIEAVIELEFENVEEEDLA